jgi:hypothetical protein
MLTRARECDYVVYIAFFKIYGHLLGTLSALALTLLYQLRRKRALPEQEHLSTPVHWPGAGTLLEANH